MRAADFLSHPLAVSFFVLLSAPYKLLYQCQQAAGVSAEHHRVTSDENEYLPDLAFRPYPAVFVYILSAHCPECAEVSFSGNDVCPEGLAFGAACRQRLA